MAMGADRGSNKLILLCSFLCTTKLNENCRPIFETIHSLCTPFLQRS